MRQPLHLHYKLAVYAPRWLPYSSRSVPKLITLKPKVYEIWNTLFPHFSYYNYCYCSGRPATLAFIVMETLLALSTDNIRHSLFAVDVPLLCLFPPHLRHLYLAWPPRFSSHVHSRAFCYKRGSHYRRAVVSWLNLVWEFCLMAPSLRWRTGAAPPGLITRVLVVPSCVRDFTVPLRWSPGRFFPMIRSHS